MNPPANANPARPDTAPVAIRRTGHRRNGRLPRAGGLCGPTEREWDIIEAVARVAEEIGASSAEVALAWVRPPEQLRANLASLEITLTPRQRAALDATPRRPRSSSPPTSPPDPAPCSASPGQRSTASSTPAWPILLASSARY
jgi:hypothetical protein